MAEGPVAPNERLDSWKAIAEFLGRDVATVRRWEKTQRLPVRRVPGGRGHSVFAYRSEIDAWLQSPREASPAPAPRPRWHYVAAALVVVGALAVWRALAPSAEASGLSVEVTPKAVVARGPDGAERWRYLFPAQERTALADERTDAAASILAGEGGVVVGTSHRLSASDRAVLSGQLLWLSAAGALERSFSFEDRVTFGSTAYAPPWAIVDYRIDETPRGRRFAVAAHHFEWWPSLVTVLDDRWRRAGTFVNAGWVERVQWLSPDSLLIAGFSNARDGGMVALLDPGAIAGQSPPSGDDTSFRCASCGGASAVRYVVLPRSELNRATGSPFNRARVQLVGDRLIVHTVEVPADGPLLADAVYEFSRGLEPQSASFGDRYWERHRLLEAEGKLRHTREQCSERDGPREIEVWQPATGWRTRPARR